jgi:hypothetical protein
VACLDAQPSKSFQSVKESFFQQFPFLLELSLHSLVRSFICFVVNNCLHQHRRLFIAFQKRQHLAEKVVGCSHYTKIKTGFRAAHFTIKIMALKKREMLRFEVKSSMASSNCYFAGFTSTSMGSKDSFLPHLGHFPSYCWRTSSGGFRSGPS